MIENADAIIYQLGELVKAVNTQSGIIVVMGCVIMLIVIVTKLND